MPYAERNWFSRSRRHPLGFMGSHIRRVSYTPTLTSVTQKPYQLRDCIGELAESLVRLG